MPKRIRHNRKSKIRCATCCRYNRTVDIFIESLFNHYQNANKSQKKTNIPHNIEDDILFYELDSNGNTMEPRVNKDCFGRVVPQKYQLPQFKSKQSKTKKLKSTQVSKRGRYQNQDNKKDQSLSDLFAPKKKRQRIITALATTTHSTITSTSTTQNDANITTPQSPATPIPKNISYDINIQPPRIVHINDIQFKWYLHGLRIKRIQMNAYKYNLCMKYHLHGIDKSILRLIPFHDNKYHFYELKCIYCSPNNSSHTGERGWNNCILLWKGYENFLKQWTEMKTWCHKHCLDTLMHRTNITSKTTKTSDVMIVQRRVFRTFITLKVGNMADTQWPRLCATQIANGVYLGDRCFSDRYVEKLENSTEMCLLNEVITALQTPLSCTDRPPPFATAKDKGTHWKKKLEPCNIKMFWCNGIFEVFTVSVTHIDYSSKSTRGDGTGLALNYRRTFHNRLKLSKSQVANQFVSQSYDYQYFHDSVPSKSANLFGLGGCEWHQLFQDFNHNVNRANKRTMAELQYYYTHTKITNKLSNEFTFGNLNFLACKKLMGTLFLTFKDFVEVMFVTMLLLCVVVVGACFVCLYLVTNLYSRNFVNMKFHHIKQ